MKKKITGIILGGVFIITSNAWAANPDTALPKIEDVSAKVDTLGEAFKAKSLALSHKTKVSNLTPINSISNGIYNQDAVQKVNLLVQEMDKATLKSYSNSLVANTEGLKLKGILEKANEKVDVNIIVNVDEDELQITDKSTGKIIACYELSSCNVTYTDNYTKIITTLDKKYSLERDLVPKFNFSTEKIIYVDPDNKWNERAVSKLEVYYDVENSQLCYKDVQRDKVVGTEKDFSIWLSKDKTKVIYHNNVFNHDVLVHDAVTKDDGYYDAVTGQKIADLYTGPANAL